MLSSLRTDGSIYFTDPSCGRTAGFGVERSQELPFQGLYRIPAAGNEIELLATDFEQPNGFCFSPDGSRLYENDTARHHVRAFRIDTDGSPADSFIFKEIARGTLGDGMKCDVQGNVYVSSPGGIWVISPNGEHLGIIQIPEVVGNFNWGGSDWRTLYIVASTSLYMLPMKTPGATAPYMTMRCR